MSEKRIQELAKQAGAEIYGHPDFANICVNGGDADDLMKKFAELILNECVSVLWQESNRLYALAEEETDEEIVEKCRLCGTKCEDNAHLIEKHFGVEE